MGIGHTDSASWNRSTKGAVYLSRCDVYFPQRALELVAVDLELVDGLSHILLEPVGWRALRFLDLRERSKHDGVFNLATQTSREREVRHGAQGNAGTVSCSDTTATYARGSHTLLLWLQCASGFAPHRMREEGHAAPALKMRPHCARVLKERDTELPGATCHIAPALAGCIWMYGNAAG